MSQIHVKEISEAEWEFAKEENKYMSEVFAEVGQDEVIVEQSDGTRTHHAAVRNEDGALTGYFSHEL